MIFAQGTLGVRSAMFFIDVLFKLHDYKFHSSDDFKSSGELMLRSKVG